MRNVKEKQLARKLKLIENKLAIAEANLKVAKGDVEPINKNLVELTESEIAEMQKAHSFIKVATDSVIKGVTTSYPTSEQLIADKENGLSFGQKLASYSENERKLSKNVNKFLGEWGR
ncbi:MAG: hypothetical protein ACRC7S_17430 [Cetobacterium sp.]